MIYLVSNNSVNRKFVCTLKSGETLRLLPKQTVKLKDSQLTDYLFSLSKGKSPLLTLRVEEKKVNPYADKEVKKEIPQTQTKQTKKPRRKKATKIEEE